MASRLSFLCLILAGALLVCDVKAEEDDDKPGLCPDPASIASGSYSKTCSEDDDCEGTKKCCNVQLNRNFCVEPQGTCPQPSPDDDDHCDKCENDSDCQCSKMCCESIICEGRVCKKPVL